MWGLLEQHMYQHLAKGIPSRARAALMDTREHIAREEFGSALTTIDSWTYTLTNCAQASIGMGRVKDAYRFTGLVTLFQAHEKDLRYELSERAKEREPTRITWGLDIENASLRDAVLVLVEPRRIVYHGIRLDEDDMVRPRERWDEVPAISNSLDLISQYTNIVAEVQDTRLDEVEIPVLCEWYRMHAQE